VSKPLALSIFSKFTRNDPPQIMPNTYPPGFDVNLAKTTLAPLITEAYAQMTAATTLPTPAGWAPPAGYDVILKQFTAKEPGGGGLFKGLEDDIHHPSDIVGNLEHGIGLLAPAQLPFGFILKKGNDIFVVIRGTITQVEWLDDADATPVPFEPGWGSTTKGFKTVYLDLIDQVVAALKATPFDPGTNLYVTGHSLGASVAHLVAARLSVELTVKPVSYTFCGPRTGDPAFAAAHLQAGLITWRIFNTEDVVPTLPMAAVELGAGKANLISKIFGSGYEHIGHPIAVTTWHADLGGNHDVTNVSGAL
jgi:hypothetical protein